MDEREKTVYSTKLHWITVAPPALLMILSGLSISSKGMGAVVVLAISLIWAILSSISLERSEFLVTAEMIVVRTGFPVRRSYDLSLTEVEGAQVYQPSLGKVLNFGKLTVKMKNGKRLSFRLVRDPLQLAGVINESKNG